MSDYIEITLDPPGVRPAWLEAADIIWKRASNGREQGNLVVEGIYWENTVAIRIPKDSPAHARYLAYEQGKRLDAEDGGYPPPSKKPEAPALPVTMELWTPEIKERVLCLLHCVVDSVRTGLTYSIEAKSILAALNPPEVDPLDAVWAVFSRIPGSNFDCTPDARSKAFRQAVAECGLTITKADAGEVK